MGLNFEIVNGLPTRPVLGQWVCLDVPDRRA